MAGKKKFYAYFVPGKGQGIADNWADCETKVKGVPNARYRAFGDRKAAEVWLHGGAAYGKDRRRSFCRECISTPAPAGVKGLKLR